MAVRAATESACGVDQKIVKDVVPIYADGRLSGDVERFAQKSRLPDPRWTDDKPGLAANQRSDKRPQLIPPPN